MRRCVLALLVAGLVALAPASAADREVKVREVDLKGLPTDNIGGTLDKPKSITSAGQLEKIVGEGAWRDKIVKQVDFGKEEILFFTWAGSGADKLTFKTEKEKDNPVLMFRHAPGKSDDLKRHVYMFVVPKDTKWRLGK